MSRGSQSAGEALANALPALAAQLAEVADADRALLGLERLAAASDEPARFLRELVEQPRRLEALLTVTAASPFLVDIMLRYPELISTLDSLQLREAGTEGEMAARRPDRAMLVVEGAASSEEARRGICRFQQRELLRLGASDLLALVDVPELTRRLSSLADQLVAAALRITGPPLAAADPGFAVLALGKLGARELNYSSDIDLVFLARDDVELLESGARRFIRTLSGTGPDGHLYRVDMRLRPWGRDGALVSSERGYLHYLESHASLSERQALTRVRCVAGDSELGERVVARARELAFADLDPDAVLENIRTLKRKIEAGLRRQGRAWGQVKSGEGSIRDVEFTAQYLQLVHCAEQLRAGTAPAATLDALADLKARTHLGAGDHRALSEGYTFFRTVEHYLQLTDNRKVHRLPPDPRRLQLLAARLGFRGAGAGDRFLARFEEHQHEVREVYRSFLEGEKRGRRLAAPDVRRLRMPLTYQRSFSAEQIASHHRMAAQLSPGCHVQVATTRLGGHRHRVEVVGYDFLGGLSMMCGLFYVHGLSIVEGQVFTGELSEAPRQRRGTGRRRRGARRRRLAAKAVAPLPRRRIVDSFVVTAPTDPDESLWAGFRRDLEVLFERLRAGELRAAQAELATRISLSLSRPRPLPSAMEPVHITFDNEHSDRLTVIAIDAPDTLGFLYELSSALALDKVSVERMEVQTQGERVHDTLFVTDSEGGKILDPVRLQKLRLAVVLTKQFTHLLPSSPNPRNALLHFRELLGDLLGRTDWEQEIASLERPEVLATLARLLGVSDFLWQDFLRLQHANLFPLIRNLAALEQPKSRAEIAAGLERHLAREPHPAGRVRALNAVKDREMFRIDMRQILDLCDGFSGFSSELTALAEAVFEAALGLGRSELAERFGLPRGDGGDLVDWSLCALGKFGGQEIGYASDLELMLLYRESGETDGPEKISAGELFIKLVEHLLRTVGSRHEGIFDVDLRLRPYGAGGPLAVSVPAFARYFATGGDAWPYERQGLVKLRPVAGDPGLGREVVELRDRLVYVEGAPDLAAARAMRERQRRHQVKAGTLNAKYSPGGLVDVEYLVQLLQLRHGGEHPGVRATNTLAAISALVGVGVLDPGLAAEMTEAYGFLRRLIDALRMVRGSARDLAVPDPDAQEWQFLARRLGEPAEELKEVMERQLGRVQELQSRLL